MSIAHDDEQAYRYELKIQQYELERMYLEDLHRNSWLSGDHKMVLWEVRQIIKRLKGYDHLEEPVHIYIAEIEGRTGLGSATVKRILKQLDEYGLITKQVKKTKVGRSIKNELWISLAAHIVNSAKWIATEHKGGRTGRQQCEKCGSDNLEYTAYRCKDCGHTGNL
jgi:DNA-binding MarR family transcriptional regulator